MDPTHCGWEKKDNFLVPVWYEGDNLPSDAEYEAHIDGISYDEEIPDDDDDMTDSFCSESEYESDDYALSETYSSSDEDDLCIIYYK